MKNETLKLYIVRAKEELEAAHSNLKNGFYRVAVTRAYYAMFHAASALLFRQGIIRRKHTGVISAFGENFVKTGLIEPEYAKMLTQAFDSRLDSDYDLIFSIARIPVEEIVANAVKFVERIEIYLDEEHLQ